MKLSICLTMVRKVEEALARGMALEAANAELVARLQSFQAEMQSMGSDTGSDSNGLVSEVLFILLFTEIICQFVLRS